MNRRGFLRGLIGTAVATTIDPEEALKLLWTPKKTIFIPSPVTIDFITLSARVGQINYPIFDTDHIQTQGGFAFLEARDLRDCMDRILIEHDKNLWEANPIVCVDKVQYEQALALMTNQIQTTRRKT